MIATYLGKPYPEPIIKEIEEKVIEIQENMFLSKREAALIDTLVFLIKEVAHQHRVDEILKVLNSKVERRY